jgi:hypothetical protein
MTPAASQRAAADILLAAIRSATPSVDSQQLQKLSLGTSSAENEQDDQGR